MGNTAKELVDHWSWAADKGVMNANTANALRAACTAVLETEKDWQNIDVGALEVDSLLGRFRNLKGKNYSPDSLKEYERRFRKAHALYLDYLRAPTEWKPAGRERPSGNGKTERRHEFQPEGTEKTNAPSKPPAPGFVEYPFPLRADRIARLVLPVDLKAGEVRRLSAFLSTLPVDAESVEATIGAKR
jgi:hypothetical protein